MSFRNARRGGPQKGGAAKKKKEPTGQLPSEAFKKLLLAGIALCEKAGEVSKKAEDEEENEEDEENMFGSHEDDGADAEMCAERAGMFEHYMTQRANLQHRLAILEEFNVAMSDQALALAMLEDAQAQELETEKLWDDLVSATMEVISETLETLGEEEAETSTQIGAEKEAVQLFQAFESLLTTTLIHTQVAKNAFRPKLGEIIRTCVRVGCNNARGNDLREAALMVSGDLIASLPSQVVEDGIVQELVNACFQLCADPTDDALDPNSFSSQNLGTTTLDLLCLNIKPVTAIAPLVLKQALEQYKDEDKYKRKASLVCLAVLPEACTAWVKEGDHLVKLFDVLATCLSDSESLVRSASFICISECVEHLQPLVATYHDVVLPNILATLQNPDETIQVKTKACIPLAQLCNVMDKKQDTITPILIKMIKDIRAKTFVDAEENELIESVNICIRSIASQSGDAFKSQASDAIELMLSMMQEDDENVWGLRATASSCVGEIASAIGQEAFAPYLERVTTSLISGMSIKSYGVRSAIHATWSELASTLKQDLIPYIPSLLPYLCRVLPNTYKIKHGDHDDDGDDQEEENNEEEEEDAEDPEDEGAEDEMSEEIEEERKWALVCYRNMLEFVGPKFLSYNERPFQLLFEHNPQYSEELKHLVANICGLLPNMFPVEKAWTAGVSLPISDSCKSLFGNTFLILCYFIQSSPDVDLVETSLDAIHTIIEHFGQVIVLEDANTNTTLFKLIKQIFQRKAICQMLNEEGDEDDGDADQEEGDDEQDQDDKPVKKEKHVHTDACNHEHDEEEHGHAAEKVIHSALGVFGLWARVRGPAFEPMLEQYFELILQIAKDDLCMGYAFGTLAEICEAVGPIFHPCVPKIFPLLLEQLNTDDYGRGHNCAFCAGVLCLKGGAAAREFFDPVYAKLKTMFTTLQAELDAEKESKQGDVADVTSGVSSLGLSDSEGQEKSKSRKRGLDDSDEADDAETEYQHKLGCRDNVVSAIGKMILVGANQLQLQEVVPLFISGLPLRVDMEESNFAYSTCLKMVNTFPKEHPGLIEAHFPRLLSIFREVLASESITSEKLRSFVIQGAQTLLALPEHGPQLINQIKSWPQHQQQAFTNLVTVPGI